METRIELKCPHCELIDHNENHFCRCEGRNIQLARQYRKDGINIWKKPDHIDVFAETEEEFVDLCLNTRSPCTVWQKGSLDQAKIDEICKERGVFLINTNIDGVGEAICLPHVSPNSDQVKDSSVLQIKWPEKESQTQTQ